MEGPSSWGCSALETAAKGDTLFFRERIKQRRPSYPRVHVFRRSEEKGTWDALEVAG